MLLSRVCTILEKVWSDTEHAEEQTWILSAPKIREETELLKTAIQYWFAVTYATKQSLVLIQMSLPA